MSRRFGLGLGGALLLGLAVLGLSGNLDRAQRDLDAAGVPATHTLGEPSGPSVTVGGHPIGLSIEYPLLAHDLGGGRCPSTAFVRTLNALGSPTLRIGGDSQDATAPAGTPAHPGAADLPADFWSRVACLERETRIPIVVGLNLASGETAWAAKLAASAREAIPASRLSFELGNEPDIYGAPVRWWNGRALLHSPMPWATYLRRATAVDAVLGARSALEGPDFASGRWIAQVPTLAQTLRLRTLDAHFYPLDACRHAAAATTTALLSRRIQGKINERVRLARDAHTERLAAAISETNSVSCGGVAGVSDRPAAAVWAVRMVLRALREGFSSVRFHASGSAYDPFVVRAGVVTARPLYLGLLAAARLLTPGAVLRAIPHPRSLDGVALTRPDGARTIMLSNYTATPEWVLLVARAPVGVVRISASAPTVLMATVRPARGRTRVEIPANSVTAISLPAS